MIERMYHTLMERLQTAESRNYFKKVGFFAAAVLALIIAVANLYLGFIHTPGG